MRLWFGERSSRLLCLRHQTLTWSDNRGIRCIKPLRSLLTWRMPRSVLFPWEAWYPLIHLDPQRWLFSHHFTGEHSLWWCRKLFKVQKVPLVKIEFTILLLGCQSTEAGKPSKTKLWLCKSYVSQSELSIVSYPTDLHKMHQKLHHREINPSLNWSAS